MNDINACYENIISKFSSLYDNYFPKQRKRVIGRNPNKPWITQGILFSIKKKHPYYKASLRKKTLLPYLNTMLTRISLLKSEKSYFMNAFESANNDIKKTW